ncbi:hypothetical protein LRR18_02075 [Mangrovimonas sp. AS39]|uniref:hypothetical protein n=1 Tax=Mangrovimonas TaxID=1211036 RepID=UPI00141DB35F|nr:MULTISPECIES: hypothetical protein [Mangrovimonas]MCF1190356.1 hypothetical protein [Mangrovimonas futianensis]MCF1193891.1 hypothetical protein [Mangrovimonas futianensis]NIK90905.1 hypothetical protein [Mangrovimonas sp. CR14]
MLIKYKKSWVIGHFIFGSIWLVLGILFALDTINWIPSFYAIMAIYYIAMGFYLWYYNYLTLNKDVIQINGFLGKKMKWEDIKNISHFAGEIKVETESKKMVISKQFVDSATFETIKNYLKTTYKGELSI